MNFNIYQYKEALQQLDLNSLRAMIIELHNELGYAHGTEQIYKDLDKSNLDESTKKSKTKENKNHLGQGTYKSIILDSLWKTPQKERARNKVKENIINFIVYFFDKYDYYILYWRTLDEETKTPWYTNPQIKKHDRQEGILYDYFYWRTNQNLIGIGSILIDNEWRTAELAIHYKNKGRKVIKFRCNIKELSPTTLSIVPRDEANNSETLYTSINLFGSHDKNERHYMLGSFNGFNRTSKNPICGQVLLKHSENRPIDESPYIKYTHNETLLINVPDEISFYLNNKRFVTSAEPILKKEELPLFKDYDIIKSLAGSYEASFFTFHQPSEPSFKIRFTQIFPNGAVVSFRDKDNTRLKDEGFIRMYRSIIVANFGYDRGQDSYKYQFYLKKMITQNT